MKKTEEKELVNKDEFTKEDYALMLQLCDLGATKLGAKDPQGSIAIFNLSAKIQNKIK